ncbi:MAG: hypothetical protein ACREMV_04130 [Gemmatimonadales bacterium]
MKRPMQEVVTQGFMGGVVAAMVVAAWFLFTDLAAGRAFFTPTMLGAALFNREVAAPTFGLLAAYSILHFGVFALLGTTMAFVIAPIEAPPRLLLGVVFGLVVLDAVFYAALLLTGVEVLVIVPWYHVLAANIVSGVALMWYLRQAQHDPRPFGPAALRSHPLLARGLVIGLVGAAAVALWFLILELAAGRPFRTPAALGSALLLGASGPHEIQVSIGVVATYTVVHLAAFWAAGVAFVALAEQLERTPGLIQLAVMAGIVLEGLVVGTLAVGAQWVLGVIGWWTVLVGNAIAVAAMGWLVWRAHPALGQKLREATVKV